VEPFAAHGKRRSNCRGYLSAARSALHWRAADKHAAKEESFAAVFGAGIVLVLIGTVTYSLGEDWSVADGFYFAVCTLTTSSIADPDLTLTSEALKILTALYVLTGIGILVELARQLGVGFMRMGDEQMPLNALGVTRVTRRRRSRRNSRVHPAASGLSSNRRS
jgi:hypothetical protein